MPTPTHTHTDNHDTPQIQNEINNHRNLKQLDDSHNHNHNNYNTTRLRQAGTREFWIFVAVLVAVFWLRMWTHAAFQWGFLLLREVPVTQFELKMFTVTLKFVAPSQPPCFLLPVAVTVTATVVVAGNAA
jgi:hypothetical protein